MSRAPKQEGRAARALRAAGYSPLPRLWVTEDQMDVILRIAKGNVDEISRIRDEALAPYKKEDKS